LVKTKSNIFLQIIICEKMTIPSECSFYFCKKTHNNICKENIMGASQGEGRGRRIIVFISSHLGSFIWGP